jgi:hypothetical protein
MKYLKVYVLHFIRPQFGQNYQYLQIRYILNFNKVSSILTFIST